jgi:hypothetical protein
VLAAAAMSTAGGGPVGGATAGGPRAGSVLVGTGGGTALALGLATTGVGMAGMEVVLVVEARAVTLVTAAASAAATASRAWGGAVDGVPMGRLAVDRDSAAGGSVGGSAGGGAEGGGTAGGRATGKTVCAGAAVGTRCSGPLMTGAIGWLEGIKETGRSRGPDGGASKVGTEGGAAVGGMLGTTCTMFARLSVGSDGSGGGCGARRRERGPGITISQ